MKVYIAGKITGSSDYKKRFEKAEKELTEMGYTVINPIKPLGFTYKEYIDMGLNELMRCDAIYMLDGYQDSRGALLELTYARTIGMMIIRQSEG